MVTFLSKDAKISLIEPLTIILEATYYDDEGNIENSGEWGVGSGGNIFRMGYCPRPNLTVREATCSDHL
ncbi:MAG TPA: hypothetical protein DCL61_03655 [Cyanobacteria bacterium UBA12227]|nr:hypothetical protein [Cyanobacteria bacterium UBA12227]HAX89662.1 hypothetical protein [Cyanobacteria bacterium UBA11370]HBY79643.1 hypothetical protein [Cyanobacteria bacterium UBA11148]